MAISGTFKGFSSILAVSLCLNWAHGTPEHGSNPNQGDYSSEAAAQESSAAQKIAAQHIDAFIDSLLGQLRCPSFTQDLFFDMGQALILAPAEDYKVSPKQKEHFRKQINKRAVAKDEYHVLENFTWNAVRIFAKDFKKEFSYIKDDAQLLAKFEKIKAGGPFLDPTEKLFHEQIKLRFRRIQSQTSLLGIYCQEEAQSRKLAARKKEQAPGQMDLASSSDHGSETKEAEAEKTSEDEDQEALRKLSNGLLIPQPEKKETPAKQEKAKAAAEQLPKSPAKEKAKAPKTEPTPEETPEESHGQKKPPTTEPTAPPAPAPEEAKPERPAPIAAEKPVEKPKVAPKPSVPLHISQARSGISYFVEEDPAGYVKENDTCKKKIPEEVRHMFYRYIANYHRLNGGISKGQIDRLNNRLAFVIPESSASNGVVTDMNFNGNREKRRPAPLSSYDNALVSSLNGNASYTHQTNFGLLQVSTDRLGMGGGLGAVVRQKIIDMQSTLRKGHFSAVRHYCETDKFWDATPSQIDARLEKIKSCSTNLERHGDGSPKYPKATRECFAKWALLCPKFNIHAGIISPLATYAELTQVRAKNYLHCRGAIESIVEHLDAKKKLKPAFRLP